MAPLLSATGVVAVPALIDQRLARLLYTTLLLRQHRGEGRQDDHVPSATSFWGDSTLDAFHLTVLPGTEISPGPGTDMSPGRLTGIDLDVTLQGLVEFATELRRTGALNTIRFR